MDLLASSKIQDHDRAYLAQSYEKNVENEIKRKAESRIFEPAGLITNPYASILMAVVNAGSFYFNYRFKIEDYKKEREEKAWDDVPEQIKATFEKLGIPEAERKFLAGVGAQYESEMVYHNIQAHLEDKGVIYLSIEDGLRQHPDLFRQYFGTVIPYTDNKFAALNGAVLERENQSRRGAHPVRYPG